MLKIDLVGVVVALSSKEKRDPDGKRAIRDGFPLSVISLVQVETEETLRVAVPAVGIKVAAPLDQVEVKGLRMGVYQGRPYYQADEVVGLV